MSVRRVKRAYNQTPESKAKAKAGRKAANREHDAIVRGILQWLWLKRIPATETDSGAVFIAGKPVKRANCYPGWPDITGCLPNGRLFGVEVKGGLGQLSAVQVDCATRIILNGGAFVRANSIADGIDSIQSLLRMNRK
jgi:hypothetical protein